MDLNGPGVSLFQGNELNNFETMVQGEEEEEEALEEQRRRDIELKNMLENAFDDVSLDNDEGSICNGSLNQSHPSHFVFQNNSLPGLDTNVFNDINENQTSTDCEKNYSSDHIENFNTPIKHATKSSQVKRVDFSNDSDGYSDQYRKKIQNGSLHDIVDASGGGEDVPLPSHYKHCLQKGEMNCNKISCDSNDSATKLQYTEEAHDSSEQLKILYDVRVREVHRLTELIDSLRNKHELELKEVKHQLGLTLAEKERANISQSHLQSLLVASKQHSEELADAVSRLEKANKELEDHSKKLVDQLELAKLINDDLQRKVLALEKGNKNESKAMQYECNLKALTEKHNMEMLNLKKDLDSCIKNYETVVGENEELKLKVNNLIQINDENLAKKSEIITRLSKQIDETQKQCENLMRSTTCEDNIRLQMELKVLKEEKSNLTLKIENLEKENSRLEEEIKQYESLSWMSSQSSNFLESKDLDNSEMKGRLGAELFRALNGLKAKRHEIKNLQTQLQEKSEQITELNENEKILKLEVTKLKEEVNKYLSEIKNKENLVSLKEAECKNFESRLNEMKKSLAKMEVDFQNEKEELNKEQENLKNKITNLEKEKIETMSNYSEEYMRFHNEGLERVRGETEKHFKLELLKKDLEMESLRKEIEEIKNLYVEVYNSKESLLEQLEKERNTSGKSGLVDLEEVKRLQKELDKSRQRILELDQTLKQQYQQEVEILNLDINQLKLQVEKMKKEKDREIAEKDRISVENELLKSEIEHVTSEKNLLFLNCEKQVKEIEELHKSVQRIKESSKCELAGLIEKHESELQNLTNKYEITVKKLNKEIELALTKSLKSESKYTSPMKGGWSGTQNVAVQGSPILLDDKSTSPIRNLSLEDSDLKKGSKRSSPRGTSAFKDVAVSTEPEPIKISKKEVVELMEKLGAHHEEEMKAMESKYRMELIKFDKKFHVEVDKAKELIHRELKKEHLREMEQLKEKHKIEMENRIEQEKKEAVVDLITEWACEVQSLKVSYAEAQAEMERMKMKYKAAKSVALQYKTYFKSKAEHMKEEWKKIEDGYERALKELEKNVHILVDVKEDEVKAKVESITKIYEQKINKMKEKLSKCENRLKSGRGQESKRKGENSKSPEKFEFKKELEKLSMPNGVLCERTGLSKRKMSFLNEKSNDCDRKDRKAKSYGLSSDETEEIESRREIGEKFKSEKVFAETDKSSR